MGEHEKLGFVEVFQPGELERAVQRELDELGTTYAGLEAQAERGEFQSERARRAWFMIAPM